MLFFNLFGIDANFAGQGTYGPFIDNVPIQVPLWLALQLKKIGHCHISPPEWLTVGALVLSDRDYTIEQSLAENLRQILKQEREELNFASLPSHYIEISELLLRQ